MFSEGNGVNSPGPGDCAGGPVTLTGNFSLGDDAAERRANLVGLFRTKYDLTPEQAAGAVGNLMWESGGQDLPPNHNETAPVIGMPNPNDRGYGWAQWSFGRKTRFVAFMNEKNFYNKEGTVEPDKVGATDAANFGYLSLELADDYYKKVLIELKKHDTPEAATESFMNTFERPNAAFAHLAERQEYAKIALDDYKTLWGGDCNPESVDSIEYGKVTFPLQGTKDIVTNPGIFHNGTTETAGHPYIAYDIMSPGGTPVVAFMDGVMSYKIRGDFCSGDAIVVWNEEYKIGISYLHMQPGSLTIKEGDAIKMGEKIGEVGRDLPSCNGDHLHIDASTDKIRQPCSRHGCSSEIKSHFRSMGKPLFDTYQKLSN